MKRINLVMVVLLVIAAAACNPWKKYEEAEKTLIADYISKNKITETPDANGIYFIELKAGSGDLLQEGDSVGVRYRGTFLNGREFDSNLDTKKHEKPFYLAVGSPDFIEGWSLALVKMKLGTKARVLLPSKVAYGPTGIYSPVMGGYQTVIPPYTPLLFEMEVVELPEPEVVTPE